MIIMTPCMLLTIVFDVLHPFFVYLFLQFPETLPVILRFKELENRVPAISHIKIFNISMRKGITAAIRKFYRVPRTGIIIARNRHVFQVFPVKLLTIGQIQGCAFSQPQLNIRFITLT